MKQRKPIVKNDDGKIIREIDTISLDQRIKSKRIMPGQKPDATEQLIFDNPLVDSEDESDSMLPDYVKKNRKIKSQ